MNQASLLRKTHQFESYLSLVGNTPLHKRYFKLTLCASISSDTLRPLVRVAIDDVVNLSVHLSSIFDVSFHRTVCWKVMDYFFVPNRLLYFIFFFLINCGFLADAVDKRMIRRDVLYLDSSIWKKVANNQCNS